MNRSASGSLLGLACCAVAANTIADEGLRPVGTVVATVESNAIIEYTDGTQRLRPLGDELGGCTVTAFFYDSIGLSCGQSEQRLLLSESTSLPPDSPERHDDRIERRLEGGGVKELFADHRRLLAQVLLRPAIRNGSIYGYKIDELSHDGELTELGLRVGDVIVEIDGAPASRPDQFVQTVDGLAAGREFSIVIDRAKERLRLDYSLE